jgi:Ca2+-binding RTX toxin-like protein
MATVKLGTGGTYETLNDHEWFEQFKTMSEASETQTTAEYEDIKGNTISMVGKNLDSSNPGSVTGTVSDIEISDSQGRLIFDVSKLSLSFAEINAAAISPDSYSILEVLRLLLKGNDTITGTNGSEELMTSPDGGNDTVYGLGGNDLFRGGPGNNTLDGGAGLDNLFYQSTALWDKTDPQIRGVVLDAVAGTATNPWGGHDHIANFEKYRGSIRHDVMNGSGLNEKVVLLGGNDTLNGRGGVDTVDYSYDASYKNGDHGITADLGSGKIIDPYGRTDTVANMESLIATNFADTIKGSSRDEFFRAQGGDDQLMGRGGQDVFLFADDFDRDLIRGFVAKGADHDIIQFTGLEVGNFSELREDHMAQSGNDVVINLGGGNVLTLRSTDIDDLSASDFLL